MDKLTQDAIRRYALYGTPASVYKEMRNEFGENSLSYSEVKKIRERYRKEILQERKDLTAKLPILDKQERFVYLQTILDGALEPQPILDRQGNLVGYQEDRKNALAALKLAHEQTQVDEGINSEDEELIRAIVVEAFEEVRKNSEKSDSELLDEMISQLPASAKPYVEELKQELVNVKH